MVMWDLKMIKSDCDDMSPLKDCTKNELALPIKESLVIKHFRFKLRKITMINKGKIFSIHVVVTYSWATQ
jgi:hypothetical protein